MRNFKPEDFDGSGVNPHGPADTICTNCGGTGLIKEKRDENNN